MTSPFQSFTRFQQVILDGFMSEEVLIYRYWILVHWIFLLIIVLNRNDFDIVCE